MLTKIILASNGLSFNLSKVRIQLASMNAEVSPSVCWVLVTALQDWQPVRCSWILTAVRLTEKFPVSPSQGMHSRKPILISKTQRNSLKTNNYSSCSLLLFLAHGLPPTTLLSFLLPLQASNPSLSNHFPLDWVLHSPAESAVLLTRRRQQLALLHHAVAAPALGQERLNFLALSCLPWCDLLTLESPTKSSLSCIMNSVL